MYPSPPKNKERLVVNMRFENTPKCQGVKYAWTSLAWLDPGEGMAVLSLV